VQGESGDHDAVRQRLLSSKQLVGLSAGSEPAMIYDLFGDNLGQIHPAFVQPMYDAIGPLQL